MACKNRAKIVSDKISDRQLERALAASNQAKALGCPFTHQLVVHWSEADGGGTVQERHRQLLIRARHWLGRKNAPLVCLWSIEPDNIGRGHHSHTLLHLPRGLARGFAAMLPIWTNTQPLDLTQARWKRRRLPKGALACGGYPDTPTSPIWLLQRRYNASPRLISYVLKAHQPHHRGRVVGKRVGYSQTISPWLISQPENNNEIQSLS